MLRRGAPTYGFAAVTRQTAASDDQDACTLGSPTAPASVLQRRDADFLYSPRPLLPQICQSIPIAGSVPCLSPVRLPQSGSSLSAHSSLADLHSEIPSALLVAL